jgi:hypothetical protein
LQSTLTGQSGTAAVMASAGPVSSQPNNCMIALKDVHLQLPTDPSLTGFNFYNLRDCSFDNVWVNTPDMIPFGAQGAMTHSNNYGVKTPANNFPCFTPIRNLKIWNQYSGALIGELCVVDSMVLSFCKIAVEFDPSYHLNLFKFLQILECPTGLFIPNSGAPSARVFRVDALGIENANSGVSGINARWDLIHHLTDTGNLAHALINYCAVDASTGASSTFDKLGGTHVTATDMRA